MHWQRTMKPASRRAAWMEKGLRSVATISGKPPKNSRILGLGLLLFWSNIVGSVCFGVLRLCRFAFQPSSGWSGCSHPLRSGIGSMLRAFLGLFENVEHLQDGQIE